MSYFGSTEWYQKVSSGAITGHSLVHKFGAGTLTSSFAPITSSSFYRTPTSVATLEIVSTSGLDSVGDSGAQQVTVVGLDSNWREQTVVVDMNGTTPEVLGSTFVRVYRFYVSRTGAYASQTKGSHDGTITLRGEGAGDIWGVLTVTPFPVGQSQIGCYTVPINKKAYLLSKNIFVDSTKSADLYFFKREFANDVTTPFSGTMRLVEREVGITGGYNLQTVTPKYLGAGPMDLGFMGKVTSGSGECSVEFELLIVDI